MRAALVVALASLLSIGCPASPTSSSGQSRASQLAGSDHQDPAEAAGYPRGLSGAGLDLRSCAVEKPRPIEREVRAVSQVADLAGKRWLVAQTGPVGASTPALLHLGPKGQLVQTKLPTWTEDTAVELPSTLRFLVTTDKPRWWTVDVSEPDRPVVHKPVRLAGLEPGKHPKGFASDGTRALISMYRTAPAGSKPPYVGETALYQVPSGTPTTDLAPVTVWAAECLKGICYGLGTPNRVGADGELRQFRDGGHQRLKRLSGWDCAGAAQWRVGSHWLLAFPGQGVVRLLAVDLPKGRVASAKIAATSGRCSQVTWARMAGRDGIVVEDERSHFFVSVSTALEIGSPELLPKLSDREHVIAPMADGAFLVSFTSAGGMIHGPRDPSGMVEYHNVWDFTGQAGLLYHQDAAWALVDAQPLPRAGESGEFSDGLRGQALTRPGYAMALVVGSRGEPGASVLLRQPCSK